MTAVLLVALAGCGGLPFGGGSSGPAASVRAGQTEAEVEKAIGKPAERLQKSNGEVIRYYSQLPEGRQIFAARFGRDGKLIAMEPTLTDENLERIKAGVTRAEAVREILGPPHRVVRYSLTGRDVWEYPMTRFGTTGILQVEFGSDQVVRGVLFAEEMSARPV